MHKRTIAVVGLGYVGLPVAVNFGLHGHCIGFDIDHTRILELQQCIDRTHEVTSDELKKSAVVFTYELEDLKKADFYIIAVPTPVDGAHQPDLRPLELASQTVGKAIKPGDIVVYESTVYPGVTEEFCLPILEEESGLVAGVDFKIGYSPERINPGDKIYTFTKVKKIVSACDFESLEIVAEVYESVVTAGVHKAASIKVAEAAKVIENTQRDLNIALMNELSVIFDRMGIDTLDVLEAAGSKWNFLPFRPGLVGGHCIGVDPYYLTHKAEILGYIPQVILAGRRINDNMGRYVARRGIKELIKAGHSVTNLQVNLLGITFKENCPDIRNSKVGDIVNELRDYNAEVIVHDPEASTKDTFSEYQVKLTSWDELPRTNLMIIAVSHSYYRNLKIEDLCAKLNPQAVIIDVKSILPRETLIERGFRVWRL